MNNKFKIVRIALLLSAGLSQSALAAPNPSAVGQCISAAAHNHNLANRTLHAQMAAILAATPPGSKGAVVASFHAQFTQARLDFAAARAACRGGSGGGGGGNGGGGTGGTGEDPCAVYPWCDGPTGS